MLPLHVRDRNDSWINSTGSVERFPGFPNAPTWTSA
jgi:hypothetical protein